MEHVKSKRLYCLPIVDAYRTICIAPPPEVRAVFDALRGLGSRTSNQGCGGNLKFIAAIEEPSVIVKILAHLGLPTRVLPRHLWLLRYPYFACGPATGSWVIVRRLIAAHPRHGRSICSSRPAVRNSNRNI